MHVYEEDSNHVREAGVLQQLFQCFNMKRDTCICLEYYHAFITYLNSSASTCMTLIHNMSSQYIFFNRQMEIQNCEASEYSFDISVGTIWKALKL